MTIPKQIIVTGGARGIGLHIIRYILKHLEPDCTIYVVQRSKPEDSLSFQEHFHIQSPDKQKIVWISADLSKLSGIQHVKSEIEKYTNKIHVLINNSGATWGEPIESHSEIGYDKVMDTNVKAPFFMTQKFLPLLRNASQDFGVSRIINIGSINGIHVPSVNNFAYSGSKAAIHMQTQHFASFLAPEITCNAIACGLFETKMTKGVIQAAGSDNLIDRIPMKQMGSELDVGLVVALFMKSKWITGAIVVLDGGASLRSAM